MSDSMRDPRAMPEVTEDAVIERMLRCETPKETFFLLYARLIEMRLKEEDLIYEEEGILRLTKKDGSVYKLYLENLWITCRDDRKAGRETVEQYLAVAERLGEESAVTRETIIPWVKDQAYVDLFAKDSDIARQHLAADLWIVYASQGEGSSSSVTNRALTDLGVSGDELRDLAIANLRRILPEIQTEDFGPWSLMWAGADYVPSLLLFDDLWDSIASKIEGDIVAAVPVSDSLFFTCTSSPDGVAHIRKRAMALEAEGDHVVSSTLLRRILGGWTAFD